MNAVQEKPDPYADLIVRSARVSGSLRDQGHVGTATIVDELINAVFALRERVHRSEAWSNYHDAHNAHQRRKNHEGSTRNRSARS